MDAFLGCANNRLLYSLPTGAGKSLVAEVLLLLTVGGCRSNRHASPPRDVLMIQPYVSIVEEKAAELKALGKTLGFNVELFAGSRGNIIFTIHYCYTHNVGSSQPALWYPTNADGRVISI